MTYPLAYSDLRADYATNPELDIPDATAIALALNETQRAAAGLPRYEVAAGPLGYRAVERATNLVLLEGSDAGGLLQACHDRLDPTFPAAILLGPGEFRGSAVAITKGRVSLRGAGVEATTLLFDVGVGDAATNPPACVVEELRIFGASLRFASNGGTLRRVTVQQSPGWGITLDGLATAKSYNVNAFDCRSLDNALGAWLEGPNLSDSYLFGCYGFRGTRTSPGGGDGFRIQGGNIKHVGCHAYFLPGYGFVTESLGQHCELVGCASESNDRGGVRFESWYSYVTGGEFYNNGLSGAAMPDCADLYLLNASHSRLDVGGEGKFTGAPAAPWNVYVDGGRSISVRATCSAAGVAHVEFHNAQLSTLHGSTLHPEKATPTRGALVFSGSSNNNVVSGSVLTHPTAAVLDEAAATMNKNRVPAGANVLNGPVVGSASVVS